MSPKKNDRSSDELIEISKLLQKQGLMSDQELERIRELGAQHLIAPLNPEERVRRSDVLDKMAANARDLGLKY